MDVGSETNPESSNHLKQLRDVLLRVKRQGKEASSNEQ